MHCPHFSFCFQQTTKQGYQSYILPCSCCLGLFLLHHPHCVSPDCMQSKAGTKSLFSTCYFLLSFFYLLFPGCTSKCIIKMCFTVNSESVSHAGVICQFQSVASEIQSYNTCSDTVCTRTVPVFCVAYLHTRLCHRGSCSSITAVHRRRLHGRGGGLGIRSATPQCFHNSKSFTVDSETI